MSATGIEALVCEDIAQRQLRGLVKYNVSVADNPLTLRQWLQHAYEEGLDQAIYLKRAMIEIDAREHKVGKMSPEIVRLDACERCHMYAVLPNGNCLECGHSKNAGTVKTP